MIRNLLVRSFIICCIFVGTSLVTFGQQTTQFFGVSLRLNECKYAGGLVKCYLTVTSNGEDRYIDKPSSFDGNNHWNIWDGSGKVFNIQNVRYGNRDAFDARLVADLPTPMVITADFSGEDRISQLEMAISVGNEWMPVRFKNIPVQNLSPGPVSKKPFAESHGFTVVLNRCDSVLDGTLTCKFNITSNGIDRTISAWDRSSEIQGRLVDTLGNQYSFKKILFGNQTGRVQLTAGISKPMLVTLAGFSGDAEGIALIDIGLETYGGTVFTVGFRNVPVNADPIALATKSDETAPKVPAQRPAKPSVESNGFTVMFEKCDSSKGSLLCTFEITSNGVDRYILSKSSSSRIVDNLANEYGYPTFRFSNQGSFANLVGGIGTKLTVSVDGFSEDASSIALISMVLGPDEWPGNAFNVSFKNLALNADTPSISSPSANNIAFQKTVYIQTNHAEDDGQDCRTASEVTDGILDGKNRNCAADGVIGFQNNDYNQLMEITVKIDLRQTYNITKIRYSTGNVQRAETWNADTMTSPFGRIATVPGSTFKGAWTEQTGNLTTSIFEIKFQKTRKAYAEDWLFIGEIELIGTLAKAGDLPVLRKRDPDRIQVRLAANHPNMLLAIKISDALDKKGWSNVTITPTENEIIIQGLVPKDSLFGIMTIVNSFKPKKVQNNLVFCDARRILIDGVVKTVCVGVAEK